MTLELLFFLEALGEHFGALGAASGPLGSAPRTTCGPFCDVCGGDFGVYFSRAVVPGIELDLAPFPNFVFVFPDFRKIAHIAPIS